MPEPSTGSRIRYPRGKQKPARSRFVTEPTPAPRFTLRQLPLPAKLVVTCFLLAVGLGYSSAMVQLHMQDARSGKPMPTVADVVAKFTGKRWHESAPPRQVSKLEKLIMGPAEGAPF